MQPTDIIIDFTTGLSGSVAWPWPIAVYLFLAGISGGAVALAVILNLFSHSHADTPQMKAASIVGLITILLGMVCLVLDLTDPFQFWRILIYYNPTSVMSIGVMALLFYIPLLFVLTLLVFKDLKILAFLKPITDFLAGFRAVGLGRDDFSNRDLRLHRLPDFRIDSLPAYQYGRSSGAVRCIRFFCRRSSNSSGGDGIRCPTRRCSYASAACGRVSDHFG